MAVADVPTVSVQMDRLKKSIARPGEILADGAELQLQEGAQSSWIRSSDVVSCPKSGNEVAFRLKHKNIGDLRRNWDFQVPILVG